MVQHEKRVSKLIPKFNKTTVETDDFIFSFVHHRATSMGQCYKTFLTTKERAKVHILQDKVKFL
jgi:hypothetical protein